jgi:type IV conjugative transfer system protein TraL
MEEKFPQYLSSPLQILWFETDDLGIILLCFMVGSMIGGLSWALLLAGPYVYAKFKKKYPPGFFQHLLYFVGLKTMKDYPNPFANEFQE